MGYTTVEDVSPQSVPLIAGPNDMPVGFDELGGTVYKSVSGEEYTLYPETKTKQERPIVAAAKAVGDYIADPSLPSLEQTSEFAKETAKAAYEPFRKIAHGDNPTFGDVGEVLTTVSGSGLAASGKNVLKTDPTQVNIFAGLRAQNPPSKTFKEAEQMVELGTNSDAVWRHTGWRKGQDKKWRFEIDDTKSKYNWETIKPEINKQTRQTGRVKIDTTVGEALAHNKLYEQYPELRNARLVIRDQKDGAHGAFYPSTGTIELSPKLSEDAARKTLLHEIQHWVQNKEQFFSGANTAQYEGHPEVMKLLDDQRAAREKWTRAAMNNAPEAEVLRYAKEVNDLTKDITNLTFRFYRGKAGEIESRLVEERVDMDSDMLPISSPSFNEKTMLLSEAKKGWEAIPNIRGDKSKVKADDIIIPANTGWSDEAILNDAFSRDKDTAPLLAAVGSEITVPDIWDDNKPIQVELKGIKFYDADVADLAYRETEYPDIKLSDGRVPVLEYKKDGGDWFIPLSSYLQHTANKRDTAGLRFGQYEAPMYVEPEGEWDFPELEELPEITTEQGYAKGGVVEHQMKKLMKEGGVATENAEVDAISGNEVPPGALPEEVRDDVDAKLSSGEYVVPADVVRFFGVDYFEKLRKKAKHGLAEMEKDGRIGGEPTEDDDDEELPFDMEELEVEDDDEMAMQTQEAGFAEGGYVAPNTPRPGFVPTGNPATDPQAFAPGFSVFGQQNTGQPSFTTKTYVNATGQQLVVQFDAQGKPVTPIPQGYYELGTTPPAQAVKPPVKERGEGSGAERDSTNKGDGFRSKDWGSVSGDEAVSAAMGRLDAAEKSGAIGGTIGGMLGGALGGLGGLGGKGLGKAAGIGTAVSDALGVANARERVGDTASAAAIRDAVSAYTDDLPAATKSFVSKFATGKWGLGAPSAAGSAGSTSTGTRGGSINGNRPGQRNDETSGSRTRGGISATGTATAGSSVSSPSKGTPSAPTGPSRSSGGISATGSATGGVSGGTGGLGGKSGSPSRGGSAGVR